jgi:hypothetical protein
MSVAIHIVRFVTEKRVPASILIESPWFETHGIREIDDAVSIVRHYFQDTA